MHDFNFIPGPPNPIFEALIDIYVVEKSIVNKHGDATARHRTDIETEWRHRTFPRRFAPLLCSRMLVEIAIYTTVMFNEVFFDDFKQM